MKAKERERERQNAGYVNAGSRAAADGAKTTRVGRNRSKSRSRSRSRGRGKKSTHWIGSGGNIGSRRPLHSPAATIMLLAAAGQAAPYTYDSSATRKIGSNNNNNNNVSNVSASTSTPTTASAGGGTGGVGTGTVAITARPPTSTTTSIASSAATALMQKLSVRLHRGTEFIKDTVQKALVMSATTPVTAPLDSNQSLKRKLIGAGGIMGSGGGSGTSSSSGAASSSNTISSIKTYGRSSTYVVPTAAFLRKYTVAPSELHRSASARKRNASTDSLLMDLCIFKPIRPMPITPIKM